MFSKHHYLSDNHNNAAMVYLAIIDNQIAGFLSVLHFPHATSKKLKKVHRLVILPDYQGLGFGIRFLNEVGKLYLKDNWRYIISTSSPSLIYGLRKSKEWILVRYGRAKESFGVLRNTTSKNRITASFELKTEQ